MKKLNRRQLRSMLLKELRSINEESGLDAFLKTLEKQKAEYERVANSEGVMAMVASMLVGIPSEAIVGMLELLADKSFRSELESKYDNEGFEQAYVFWVNALSKEVGL